MTDKDVAEKPWIKPGKWAVSPFNYADEIRSTWKLPNHVIIHDVTLRDGEQTPGVVFRMDEKVKIAHALTEIGVQRIEGGMASVSREDAKAIATMAKEISTAEIVSFVRTRKDDIDLAIKCGVDRVTIEMPCRTHAIRGIWRSTEKAVETLVELVTHVREHGLKASLFLTDATRANLNEIKTIIVPAVDSGKANSVAIVDTEGCTLPQSFAWLIKKVKDTVNVPVEVHCHNSWGLATANSLAAVTAGAEVIHTTINGLGGNTALDEVVMDLKALIKMDINIKTEKFKQLSDTVKDYSGVAWYKPLIGELQGLVEVGIETATLWKTPELASKYRTVNLELVGGKNDVVVLGKKSGRYSIILKARELGLPIPSEERAYRILARIKRLSEKKKGLVADEEFRKIYTEEKNHNLP